MWRAILAFGLIGGTAQAFTDLEASRGAALFAGGWTVADGLASPSGARSCADCHPGGGRGDPEGLALVLHLGGGSRHVGSLSAGEAAIAREIQTHEVRLGDGTIVELRRTIYRVASEGDGLAPASARLAPSLRGVALLGRVPASAATPGRFGLRAEERTLPGRIARALNLDLGLSTAVEPAPGDAAPEIDEKALEALTSYLEALRPRPTAAAPPADFAALGCAGCHRPSFTIPADPALTGTPTETIKPYTDLRLHDLGPALADAGGSRWRTAPLWGLRDRHDALLHDGRARSVEEAILWHGGEAETARDAYAAAPSQARAALLSFLLAL